MLSKSSLIESNKTDEDGGTPLHYAAGNGHRDVVEVLLGGAVSESGRCNWMDSTTYCLVLIMATKMWSKNYPDFCKNSGLFVLISGLLCKAPRPLLMLMLDLPL